MLPTLTNGTPIRLNNQCGNMYENNALGEIKSENPRMRGRRRVCFQPFKGFTITSEGFVSACVLDYSKDLIVGDVNKNSLQEIWEGETYKTFRRRHLTRDLKGLICFNCMNNSDQPVEPLMPEYSQKYQIKKLDKSSLEIADDPHTLMEHISERTSLA